MNKMLLHITKASLSSVANDIEVLCEKIRRDYLTAVSDEYVDVLKTVLSCLEVLKFYIHGKLFEVEVKIYES